METITDDRWDEDVWGACRPPTVPVGDDPTAPAPPQLLFYYGAQARSHLWLPAYARPPD